MSVKLLQAEKFVPQLLFQVFERLETLHYS